MGLVLQVSELHRTQIGVVAPALQISSLGVLAVSKNQQPPLFLGVGKDIALLLKGVFGRVIEGRDNSQVQMMMRRHLIP